MAAESGKTSAPIRAVTTFDVLAAEYRLIWDDKAILRDPDDYYRRVNGRGQAALCLSGGGIRSAAFALGVLQALSRKRVLNGFHYLSTVSGGGYIGGWLQRWIHESGHDATAVMNRLAAREEQPEVKRLRENSNFITPRAGLGSNDTWTAVAISVRNIGVNWLLFGPLIMLVALLPNLFLSGVESIPRAIEWEAEILPVLLLFAAAAMAWATASTVRLLPSYRTPIAAQPGAGDGLLMGHIVRPLILWAVLGTLALSIDLLGPTAVKLTRIPAVTWLDGLDLAVWTLGGLIAGLAIGAASLDRRHIRTMSNDWVIWPVAFATVTLWVAAGGLLFHRFFSGDNISAWSPVILTVFGPLWLMAATLVASIVFAAFRKAEGPTVMPDDDREWLARLSAVKIKPMLFWGVVAPAVLLLNRLMGIDPNATGVSAPSFVALLTGAIAIAGGRSRGSGGVAKGVGTAMLKYLPMSAIVALATFAFIVALLVVFGRLESLAAGSLLKVIGSLAGELPGWIDPLVLAHLWIALILLLLLVFFGRRIPVNRFSLNGLYRNRLGRAFLGAACRKRTPDPFTGFDSADNVRLQLIAPRLGPKPGDRAILYPVINVALNVTATENLAWQERKAEPFIFSPLYCGSGMLAPEGTAPGNRIGAYIDSAVYGGREKDTGMGGTLGVSLATAMSISGAAASPAMGYHSSAATAFLMTLFNVRLGAWLPNPALAKTLGEHVSRSSPDNSIRALFSELAGRTDDRGPDIYLSDGGHFENLGVYEMIRRRCRFILVSDAGADPTCTFEDLGNAVRKVKIDLDVDIGFTELRIAPRNQPYEPGPQLAWALGEISYPDKDAEGKALKGDILYIKPSYFGPDLPVDVVSYAKGSAAFPHESTGDQFFSESQFESYRRLGDHFADGLASGLPDGASVEHLFADAALKKAATSGGGKKPRAASPRKGARAGARAAKTSPGAGIEDGP